MGSQLTSHSASRTGRAAVLQRIASGIRRPAKRRPLRRFALCIVKPDGIGDFILALGAVRLLINHFGAEDCVLAVWSAVRELAAIEFPRTPQVVVPSVGTTLTPAAVWSAMQLRRKIGAWRFDELACLRHQRSRFQNLVLHWVVAGKSSGLTNEPANYLGKDCEFAFSREGPYPIEGSDGQCIELEAHRRVAEQTVCRKVLGNEVMPSLGGVGRRAGDYLLVCPFSNRTLKDYPADLLEAAVAEIQQTHAMPVRLSYAPACQERAKTLEARLRRRSVRVLSAPPTSFPQFLESVAGARAVLTVDTATAHIATALDIPTVVILGGGHYRQFGPWQKSVRQVWISNPLPCFHCNWHCTQPEAYCITRVAPARLAAAMSQVLLRQ